MSTVKRSKDQQAIRQLDEKWGDAASARKLKKVVGFYAPHASLVWPETPAVHGTRNIRAAWQKIFDDQKGVTLKFTPQRIHLSQANDMAVDFGEVAFVDPKLGGVVEKAKYVVVWTKIGREWKVLYDCYNHNKKKTCPSSKATRKRAPQPRAAF